MKTFLTLLVLCFVLCSFVVMATNGDTHWFAVWMYFSIIFIVMYGAFLTGEE